MLVFIGFLGNGVGDNVLGFLKQFFEEILGVFDISTDESDSGLEFGRFLIFLPDLFAETFCLALVEEFVHLL